MSKIFPSAAKLLSGSITKAAAPVVTTSNVKYSTKSEATFETKPFKLHKLDKGPATSASLSAADALRLYEQLAILRRIETAAGNLYKEKIIRGFCHLYSGQEAVAVGMRAAMRDVDTVITAYRCHGWTYLMGVSVLGVLSELTGRRTGCSRGKGGSMHLYGKNFFGGNGIVGAQVPLGAGVAFAHKYRGDGGVTFALYGDGAANQGQLFEAYNMAKLWDLPCVFVCENNGYGMGTSVDRSSASTEYYSRGDYVPGIWVDGMDVIATREATRYAIDYCTSGKGPLLMEMETYRYSGHSMSDPGTSYRTRDEVQEVRQTRDPITSFKDKIINSELATPDQLKMETYRYSGHSMSDPGTSYRTRDEVQEVRQTRDPITSFKDKIINSELATPDQLKMETYRYSGHSMSDPGTSYRTRDEVQEVRQTRDPITSFKDKIINSELATPDQLKMETYRYSGHSMSDPGTSYRTRDEVQEVRQTRDPITSFKDKIINSELATPDQLKEIDAKVRKEVDEATKQSKTEPEVGLEEISGDIYCNNIEPLVRGIRPDAPLTHIQVASRN